MQSIMAFFGGGSAGLDQARCIKLAIMHDIAEAIVGDITPHDAVSKVARPEPTSLERTILSHSKPRSVTSSEPPRRSACLHHILTVGTFIRRNRILLPQEEKFDRESAAIAHMRTTLGEGLWAPCGAPPETREPHRRHKCSGQSYVQRHFLLSSSAPVPHLLTSAAASSQRRRWRRFGKSMRLERQLRQSS